MLKTLKTFALPAFLLAFPSLGHAQALPTAVARVSLQAGGGYSYAEPDYGQKSIQGGSGFVDFDFRPHFGVEGDVHIIALVTPLDLAEDSYLAGPRFILPHGRFNLYAKALFGVGKIVIQEVQDNPEGGAGSYFAYAAGGGVDIRATRHLVVRAFDFEYQHWSYQTGLTPSVITVGLAYKFR